MKNYKKIEYSFEKLLDAYFDCRKHKSSTYQAMNFEFNREKNLLELHNDILNGTYEIGRSICFIVTEPKPREIWAGSFRDRIVHHLIYNALYERCTSKFIYDSYSCIVGKGALNAVKRANKFARNITQNFSKDAYFIKMDIKSYFMNIDKRILFETVKEYVDEKEEKWLLDLIRKVIFHDPRKKVLIKSSKRLRSMLPEYKSLFNSNENYGLAIGNLTSQFFSNIYLNKVDQYAKHVLKCKKYVRYVDDILVIDKSSGFLNHTYAMINRYLIDNLHLELNHRKKSINLIKKGFDYLGYVIKPNRIHPRRRTVKKCLGVLDKWKNNKNRFLPEELKKYVNSINSYMGLFRHSDAYNLRKYILGESLSLFTLFDNDYKKLKAVV